MAPAVLRVMVLVDLLCLQEAVGLGGRWQLRMVTVLSVILCVLISLPVPATVVSECISGV